MSDGSTTAVRNENVGPYMYTRGDFTRADGYRVVLYGAYNAMGLIGSEDNGIAVLDNNMMRVWCDRIGCNPSCGWYQPEAEPSKDQIELFQKMRTMPTNELIRFVNKQDRCRYKVDLQ